ncbi:DNA-binding response regulator [Rhodopirellula islandica]|uniref:DNA-binding response regulator n=1 Tax=Rhodopirellula islandica TaxID=595434 RepID=A0A0J1BHI0_RHOIS|nr:response regulator [Rhodopirellula islandica]KLU05991.1 DNA-binding response regulator [Rhodopirellula islandica]
MVELNWKVAQELPLPTIGMGNVLVVDDVAVMRTIISRVLSDLQVESVQASDGREAFEWLSKRAFNAVITDIEMPNWSGFDLVDAMRRSKDQRVATMPVIVTSTLASKAVARRARQYVGVYFLQKPISVSRLSVTLKMVATSRWLHERFSAGQEIGL